MKWKFKKVNVTCQLDSANPRHSGVEISHLNTQSFSGSQICDVRERESINGDVAPGNVTVSFIIIMNGCILIIHTLTFSANIARRNGLVRAQVI